MRPISVVIMTFNEEANIARCLESCRDIADEILVVDSFSTDRTTEIAAGMGARVIQHIFEGYAKQRLYSIGMARHDMVLVLDADEWLSDALRQSILTTRKVNGFECYAINRCNSIGGRWMRHGAWYPDRKFRFFDRRKIKILDEEPHDRIVPVPGATVSHLNGDIYHLSDADLHSRYFTINKHSTTAARHLFVKGKRSSYWRLLFKPVIRFLKEYLWQKGFLDGFYGYAVSMSSAHYVFMREAKLMELWRQKRKLPNERNNSNH